MLNVSLSTKAARSRVLLILALACFLPLILNYVVLIPIYVSVNADVAFKETLLPVFLKLLSDVLELLSFSSTYALLILSVFAAAKKTTRTITLLYLFFLLLQIPVRMLMNVPLHGSLGRVDEMIMDFTLLFGFFLLQILQFFIVRAFAATDSNKYSAFLERKKRSKRKIPPLADRPPLPFSTVYTRYNPLQRSAMKMSIMVLVFRYATRLISDIMYGAPKSVAEAFVMLAYYLSDAIFAVAAYVIAMLIISVLYNCIKKSEPQDT